MTFREDYREALMILKTPPARSPKDSPQNSVIIPDRKSLAARLEGDKQKHQKSLPALYSRANGILKRTRDAGLNKRGPPIDGNSLGACKSSEAFRSG